MCYTGFLKRGLARGPRKILQRSKWQADKDCDARRWEKHPFFPKSSQTDEGAVKKKRWTRRTWYMQTFKALVRTIHYWERGQEREEKSYIEKTEWHVACGLDLIHSCKKRRICYTTSALQRRERGQSVFEESSRVQVETEVRDILETPKPLVMTAEDWEKCNCMPHL